MCGDAPSSTLGASSEDPPRNLRGAVAGYQESNRSLSRQPGSRLRGVAPLPQAVAKRLRRTGKKADGKVFNSAAGVTGFGVATLNNSGCVTGASFTRIDQGGNAKREASLIACQVKSR